MSDRPAARELVAVETAAHLPERLRGRAPVARLVEHLHDLAASDGREEQLAALVALLRWTRRGGGAIDDESDPARPDAPERTNAGRVTARLRLLVGLFERSEPLRRMLRSAVAEIVADADAVHLFGEVGQGADRGFFAELGERAMARLLPAPPDERDLAQALRRLYRNRDEVERLVVLPLPLFERLLELIVDPASDGDWLSARTGLADGFRLLHARLQAAGLAPKLRARGSGGRVERSPFRRIAFAGERLLALWESGAASREVAAAAESWRDAATACRAEAALVGQHLEEEGVSVDIVYGLDAIERALARLEAIVAYFDAPGGERRTAALQRLLAGLARAAVADRSLAALVSDNLRLLHRRIVDRSGSTGEHYIAESRSAYRVLALAAIGGGALTVGTAAVKTLVHTFHLAPFPEALLYGLNYAVSFLLLQRWHLVLATKQPAMTAATLAGILRRHQGSERAEEIVDYTAAIVRSQLAAALGNVGAVALGCALFDALWRFATGHSWLAPDEAATIYRSLSPVNSGTVFFAALTGVILWLASLAGGWIDNWGAYHQLPATIAAHPLGRRLGRERLARWGAAVHGNLAGWGTNVVLGFLLGIVPALGTFFGVPLDVRHVTLNSGILSLAASGLGLDFFLGGWFARALAGVAVMFVLNLGVSFLLSFYTAARAYGFAGSDATALLRAALHRFRTQPGAFFFPPRES